MLAVFCAQIPLSFAQEAPLPIGTVKEFWVWDLNVMPPGSRKISATLQANGPRSYIFIENNVQIDPQYISGLSKNLETDGLPQAAFPKLGIIPMQERVFSPLPKRMRPDDRLIVLFANLGKYKNYEFDGFFNAFDQMTEADAQKEGQHSNEANIIYLNGFRQTAEYTTGVISHELQHLLASNATNDFNFSQDIWLSETLAEGAMLLAGYFTDQGHLNRFTENTWQHPLVSHSYVQYGPQLLFSSFLIDSITQGWSALSFLTKLNLKGRDAVESLYRQKTNTPLSFDAIFSNFVSYVFENSNSMTSLPYSWQRPAGSGLAIGPIKPLAKIDAFPAQLDGTLAPYSFVAIDLASALPPNSLVKVELLPPPLGISDENARQVCGISSTILWKPVTPRRIAVYAVGCEYQSKADLVNFRLKVLDRPSLLPSSPLKISF